MNTLQLIIVVINNIWHKARTTEGFKYELAKWCFNGIEYVPYSAHENYLLLSTPRFSHP